MVDNRETTREPTPEREAEPQAEYRSLTRGLAQDLAAHGCSDDGRRRDRLWRDQGAGKLVERWHRNSRRASRHPGSGQARQPAAFLLAAQVTAPG
jgi:hypothetical protein